MTNRTVGGEPAPSPISSSPDTTPRPPFTQMLALRVSTLVAALASFATAAIYGCEENYAAAILQEQMAVAKTGVSELESARSCQLCMGVRNADYDPCAFRTGNIRETGTLAFSCVTASRVAKTVGTASGEGAVVTTEAGCNDLPSSRKIQSDAQTAVEANALGFNQTANAASEVSRGTAHLRYEQHKGVEVRTHNNQGHWSSHNGGTQYTTADVAGLNGKLTAVLSTQEAILVSIRNTSSANTRAQNVFRGGIERAEAAMREFAKELEIWRTYEGPSPTIKEADVELLAKTRRSLSELSPKDPK